MTWNEMYKVNEMPNMKEIDEYVNNPLWKELCDFIENNYNTEAKIEHSICSMQPGWNVKYRKSNKSICTLYPNENFFRCMITISSKNQLDIECILPDCGEYMQKIYADTAVFNGSRWLMIDVTNNRILKDIKKFITVKMEHK